MIALPCTCVEKTAGAPPRAGQPQAAIYIDARAWSERDLPRLLALADDRQGFPPGEIDTIVIPFDREIDALEFVDRWVASEEPGFEISYLNVWLFDNAACRWDRKNWDALVARRDQQ